MKASQILHDFGITYSVETREARKVRIGEALLALKEMILGMKSNACKCGECDMCWEDKAIDSVAGLFTKDSK